MVTSGTLYMNIRQQSRRINRDLEWYSRKISAVVSAPLISEAAIKFGTSMVLRTQPDESGATTKSATMNVKTKG